MFKIYLSLAKIGEKNPVLMEKTFVQNGQENRWFHSWGQSVRKALGIFDPRGVL